MPKVSIIVPIYGVEKYIKQAVDSILSQTLDDIEIILLDDGSKDNCASIIDDYAKQDNRILVIHKPNGGYGQTCNLGLEKATGEYIAILEPDDYIDKNMYLDLYNLAQKNDSDIVKSPYYVNYDTNTKKYIERIKFNYEQQIPTETFSIYDCALLLQYHPSIWSCLYKREFLNKNKIRFVKAPGAGWTDNLFQVQSLCLAKRISYTKQAYYYWRKINQNDADDLKDYNIPFIRSNEIHDWLDVNNIKDKNILENLYYREFCYINLVLQMLKNKDSFDACEKISLMCKRMDKNIVLKSNILPSKFKRMYKIIMVSPVFLYIMKKVVFLRKNLFSIRWNKKDKKIIILGKIILSRREHDN